MTPLIRTLAFLIGCMGARFGIAFVAMRGLSEGPRLALAAFAAAVGAGMGLIHIMGWRRTGAEAGGVIWWDELRPIHAMLWLLAAACLIMNWSLAHWILFLDATVGLLSWLHHRGLI